MVGVGGGVPRHETKDFGGERQDRREGDGGERAGVEQELRDERQKEEEEVELGRTGPDRTVTTVTHPGLALQDVHTTAGQEEVDFALLGGLLHGILIGSLQG